MRGISNADLFWQAVANADDGGCLLLIYCSQKASVVFLLRSGWISDWKCKRSRHACPHLLVSLRLSFYTSLIFTAIAINMSHFLNRAAVGATLRFGTRLIIYYCRYKCEKCVAKVVSNRKSKHNKRPKLPLSLYSMHSEKERNNQVSNQPVNRFNRPSQPYSSPSSQHQSPSLKPLPN